MIWRALILLAFVGGLSIALTMALGQEVLLALGLILTQLKFLAKKLAQVEIPAILAWLKTEAHLFFRVELLKKWVYSTAVPVLVGNAILRRLKAMVQGYLDAVGQRYRRLLRWYAELPRLEKAVATLIVLFATLALAVSSLGLWLVLFSVQLPLWLLAALATLGKSLWLSARKTLFKTLAFLQLGWLMRLVRGRLPDELIEKQRRLNFRLARKVVRQRRMTVRQLSAGKDGLALRLALLRARWRRNGSA